MNEVVGGLFIILVASVLQGSFMVPMSYVKKWQWENSWALFSVLGMIGFNWVLALVSIPSLLDVYRAAPPAALATPGIFGLCWGIGAVCFGLGVLTDLFHVDALMDLSGKWVDRVRERQPIHELILDLDSSVSETYGSQERTAYNGRFGCTCYHPRVCPNSHRPH